MKIVSPDQLNIGMTLEEVKSIIGAENIGKTSMILDDPSLEYWGYSFMDGAWAAVLGFDKKEKLIKKGSFCIR